MKVLCLIIALTSCAFGRVIDSLENDVDYKRFKLLIGQDTAGDVTVRASENDVTYYLYTRNNQNSPHVVKSTDSQELGRSPHFDSNKNTVFIIHGWVDSYTADVNVLVKAAVLNKLDVNIIVVDWSPVAAGSYTAAQGAVVDIGRYVGNFVNSIIDTYKVSGDQIMLIGHSLGAHIAGNAGAIIKSKVSQIIGLDPAAPSFTVGNTGNRLDPSDAKYVKTVHTNTRLLGFKDSLGHVDFYPNGGQTQAGCGIDLLGGCSHARSFQYLAEAIQGGKFTATKCGSYSDFQNNKCTNNSKVLLGLDDKSATGDHFFDTNTGAPYAKG